MRLVEQTNSTGSKMPALIDFTPFFLPLLKFLNGKRVLVIIPYGNVGDEFLRRGMDHLFLSHGINYRTIHVSVLEKNRDQGDFDVLCWGGGGNVSGRYGTEKSIIMASEVAKAKGASFVCFPQSIEEFKDHLTVFNELFLRDLTSIKMCQKQDAHAVLVPDFALALPQIQLRPVGRERGVFFRSDSESRGDRDVNEPRRQDQTADEFMVAARAFDHVETDLLHFSIAALKQGRSVTLRAGNWHKNESMWKTWLHYLPCEFIE
jgi:exopolysaccharide biosynthesis predicted pyruvyltransferase EpsI